MKRIYYLAPLFLYLIIACNNKVRNKDSSKDIEVKNVNIDKDNSRQSLNISLVQGIWAENEEDNALFYIKDDSLYYVESVESPFFCKFDHDTLVVYGDILTKYYIKKLTNDSLWFSTDYYDGITKLYKRK